MSLFYVVFWEWWAVGGGVGFVLVNWIEPCGVMCCVSLFDVEPHDAGQYVCTVTNDVGSTRDSAELTVTG